MPSRAFEIAKHVAAQLRAQTKPALPDTVTYSADFDFEPLPSRVLLRKPGVQQLESYVTVFNNERVDEGRDRCGRQWETEIRVVTQLQIQEFRQDQLNPGVSTTLDASLEFAEFITDQLETLTFDYALRDLETISFNEPDALLTDGVAFCDIRTTWR